MLDKLLMAFFTNQTIKEHAPIVTMVLLVWLIGTLFTIMQDYKHAFFALHNTLTSIVAEEKEIQQKIKELRLLCVDKEQYLRTL